MKKRKIFCVLLVIMVVFCLQNVFAGGEQEAAEAEAEKGEITFLTWNIPMWESSVQGIIDEFHQKMPNIQVEWIDKKGSEWATFFQTQIASGTVPDVAQVQGVLWVQYAEQGLLMDLKPYLDEEPQIAERFDENMFNSPYYLYDGKRYSLPFFSTATVLYINQMLFDEAGLGQAPQTFDELVNYTQKIAQPDQGRYGIMTLNFDWLYWPFFRVNGAKVVNEARDKAAFNTPGAEKTIRTLSELTNNKAIPKLTWTGRWKEPNDLYASGNVGMFNSHGLHGFAPQAEWANKETLKVESFPERWSVPNYHGIVASSQSDHPRAAWEFMKIVTNDKWQEDIVRTLGILCGNVNVYEKLVNDPDFKKNNPLKVANFTEQLKNTDKLCGPPLVGEDEQVKEAFYSEFQKALFGETSAQEALSNAEAAVNEILSD
jgi:ABC-type glycerol-3-phosphate transport system substrate-binding protein